MYYDLLANSLSNVRIEQRRRELWHGVGRPPASTGKMPGWRPSSSLRSGDSIAPSPRCAGRTMSTAIDNLQTAQKKAVAGRPKVGGFPYLAETLRRAGVTRNLWFLPACQSIYLTKDGPVVTQGTPLVSGISDVPPFDRAALIAALRADQAGKTAFSEFLAASWAA